MAPKGKAKAKAKATIKLSKVDDLTEEERCRLGPYSLGGKIVNITLQSADVFGNLNGLSN